MASAIFFLDLKGKTLLARNYRGDIPMSAVDKFMPLLLDAEEENAVPPPCISHEGVNVTTSLLPFASSSKICSISTYDTVICTSSPLRNGTPTPWKSYSSSTKLFR
jgi:hypothetical protein